MKKCIAAFYTIDAIYWTATSSIIIVLRRISDFVK